MNKQKFFNRELSWIEFNARVLHEAERDDVPLLERLKFLGIAESNFDEFFQVRVSSLKRQKDNKESLSVLEKISSRVHQISKHQNSILMNHVLPRLAKEGISYVSPKNWTESQRTFTKSFFKHDVFPILTPQRTDGISFPHIGNLNINVAFLLEPMEDVERIANAIISEEKETLAIVQIPSVLDRVLWLPSQDSSRQFALLDDMIECYGKDLFPGYKVSESLLFKISRDADLEVDEDSGDKFIEAMEEVLDKRISSFVVRMEHNGKSRKIVEILKSKLELSDDDLYETEGILDSTTIQSVAEFEGAENYCYPKWKNFPSEELPEDSSYWNALRQHDVLLHVPYQSFDPVVRFIQNAAKDEQVLAIKMTLYRTGSSSPIVKALKEAAHNGKQVTVFVELKARFDEKRNISWASELEKAGAIVIYGIVNLKVHAKICLVVRKETDGMRRYAHFSTGNYNTKTAKIYQDLSIFTSNHELVTDATLFFNVISGYSALQSMHYIYMAPVTLKSHLLELIEREIKLSTKENPGHIIAKMNSLCHPEIIEALYKASNAGVRIDLNVRGICTLVPGVRNQSENITVTSVIDRYLEHSRIFCFQNGGAEEIYLASSDWMERNLDRRIELMFPVTDAKVLKQVKEILNLCFQDNTHSHTLQKDGSWKANVPEKKQQIVRLQEVLYKKYKKRNDLRKEDKGISQFEVRRK